VVRMGGSGTHEPVMFQERFSSTPAFFRLLIEPLRHGGRPPFITHSEYTDLVVKSLL